MKAAIIQSAILILYFTAGLAQPKNTPPDTTINNLIHTPGYKTSEYGSIPEYIRYGSGARTLILIPGWGFDASVFQDFMAANKDNYTMYAITIPGFGKTTAPPMPPEGTSYGAQSWNKGVIMGILQLIEKEKLQKPVIIGHFTLGTQLALRIAIDYPEKTGSVIIIGGQAKFIGVMNGKTADLPLDKMVLAADRYTGPMWFKHISKDDFDKGNYVPETYSLDSLKGAQLWQQSAGIPLPVMIRYLCEYIASDLKAELDKIKCPALILRAMFNDDILQASANSYLRLQFIDTWKDASVKNPLIQVTDIPGAGTFIWKDKPGEVYSLINKFLSSHL